MGQKKTTRKLVYGLGILVAFSMIFTFSLCLAFSPVANNQESTKTPADLVSTTDDAITIAMPIVEQYAEENNRTITTAEATFRNSTQPYWLVEVGLEVMETKAYHDRSGAYEVSIRADTGTVQHHGPIWVNARSNSISASDENITITVEQAIELAMPLAEEYAQENNRTITTMVEASLSNYVDSRPSWQIDIKFEAVQKGAEYWKNVQYWIDAYQVLVWADTGDIKSCSERGWY